MKPTDQQINRSTLSCFLLLILLFSVGCDTQTLAVATVADTPATLTEEVLIDAGIVFADRASYLCLPFEKVGLPADASVVSIESSCDCLTPSVVELVGTAGNKTKAVLLEFEDEQSKQSLVSQGETQLARRLRVVVVSDLAGQGMHRFSISLLSLGSKQKHD